MGNKASKQINESKRTGGKVLNLDNCDLTTFPKNLVSQFPDLLSLSLSKNLVRLIFFQYKNNKKLFINKITLLNNSLHNYLHKLAN